MLQRILPRAPSSLRTSLLSTPARSQLSSRLPAPTRARILHRWYSDAVDAQQAPAADTAETAGKAPAGGDEALRKEVEGQKKEIADLKDKYLRSVAEFRNLQDRTKRETQSAKDFAIQRFARDLIESVDNFDLALSNVPSDKLKEPGAGTEATADANKELRQLWGGLKMTETVLMNTLKKHGLERFDPAEGAEEFDPNLHEATFQAPQPDKKDGTVFHTTQKGFRLNGRVLRAAKVGVVKNS